MISPSSPTSVMFQGKSKGWKLYQKEVEKKHKAAKASAVENKSRPEKNRESAAQAGDSYSPPRANSNSPTKTEVNKQPSPPPQRSEQAEEKQPMHYYANQSHTSASIRPLPVSAYRSSNLKIEIPGAGNPNPNTFKSSAHSSEGGLFTFKRGIDADLELYNQRKINSREFEKRHDMTPQKYFQSIQR